MMPMEKKTPVRGDPRMNLAVKLKLLDPTLPLADALRKGGFKYPAKASGLTLDDQKISLTQRKNQLSRRLRELENRRGVSGAVTDTPVGAVTDTPPMVFHFVIDNSGSTDEEEFPYLAREIFMDVGRKLPRLPQGGTVIQTGAEKEMEGMFVKGLLGVIFADLWELYFDRLREYRKKRGKKDGEPCEVSSDFDRDVYIWWRESKKRCQEMEPTVAFSNRTYFKRMNTLCGLDWWQLTQRERLAKERRKKKKTV